MRRASISIPSGGIGGNIQPTHGTSGISVEGTGSQPTVLGKLELSTQRVQIRMASSPAEDARRAELRYVVLGVDSIRELKELKAAEDSSRGGQHLQDHDRPPVRAEGQKGDDVGEIELRVHLRGYTANGQTRGGRLDGTCRTHVVENWRPAGFELGTSFYLLWRHTGTRSGWLPPAAEPGGGLQIQVLLVSSEIQFNSSTYVDTWAASDILPLPLQRILDNRRSRDGVAMRDGRDREGARGRN
ncbi:hypothetical protein FB451DRAFT_1366226 [Mycena latifolia]|nr:hypothetical protein FB451DRAFT_1366226 [Mycena latifolia]